ncbi:MAG: hypothetical protein ACR2OO_02605, partial [Thermomicrobiales bacterium]
AYGLARVFGFDSCYTWHDATIKIVKGSQVAGEAMISAEAAASLSVGIGDSVSLTLPDGAKMDARISGIVDLTRARSLFSSRQGADLETFVYVPNALIVDSASFASQVVPAYERAAAGRGERVKSPPVREIDIGIDRKLLDAEPGIALVQTQRIAGTVSGVAGDRTSCSTTSRTRSRWPVTTPWSPNACSCSWASPAPCSRRCSRPTPGSCSPAPSAGSRRPCASAARVGGTCSRC